MTKRPTKKKLNTLEKAIAVLDELKAIEINDNSVESKIKELEKYLNEMTIHSYGG